MSDKKKDKETFDFSQETIRGMIEKSKEVVDDMIIFARDSEHPRAYEVLNQVIKNTSDMARALQKNVNDTKKTDKALALPPPQEGGGEKAVLLIDTAELARRTRELDKKKEENTVDVEAEESDNE